MNPIAYRPMLSEPLYRHLANCGIALFEGQPFAAVMRGAVLMEAFLSELSISLGMPRPKANHDGVFDRSWNTYPVTELTDLDPDSPAVRGFLAHIGEWAARELESRSS